MKKRVTIQGVKGCFHDAAARAYFAGEDVDSVPCETFPSMFETLKTALTEFINERQWTTLQFKRNERINCNFNITVNAYDEAANSFECALMVQSNRPVFNSNYTTTVFSTNDPNFNFNYQEYDQI